MWSVFSNSFNLKYCIPNEGVHGTVVSVTVRFEFNQTVPALDEVENWWALLWVGDGPGSDDNENVAAARTSNVSVTAISNDVWEATFDAQLPAVAGTYSLLVGWDGGLYLKVSDFLVT